MRFSFFRAFQDLSKMLRVIFMGPAVLLLRHDMSATTTGYNHSPTLSPRLDLPRFWTWFGLVPVNKLVSLTWLLWALRSFRRFTLHWRSYAFWKLSPAWTIILRQMPKQINKCNQS